LEGIKSRKNSNPHETTWLTMGKKRGDVEGIDASGHRVENTVLRVLRAKLNRISAEKDSLQAKNIRLESDMKRATRQIAMLDYNLSCFIGAMRSQVSSESAPVEKEWTEEMFDTLIFNVRAATSVPDAPAAGS
jgi:hypothetical protein